MPTVIYCPHKDKGCTFEHNSDIIVLEHYRVGCPVGSPSKIKPDTPDILKGKYTDFDITVLHRSQNGKDDNK